MSALLIAKQLAKMRNLSESIIRIFEHVLYGNPPKTINQWIVSKGGWVSFTVPLYSYAAVL